MLALLMLVLSGLCCDAPTTTTGDSDLSRTGRPDWWWLFGLDEYIRLLTCGDRILSRLALRAGGDSLTRTTGKTTAVTKVTKRETKSVRDHWPASQLHNQ